MLVRVVNKIQAALHHHSLDKNLVWMDTLSQMDALDGLSEVTSHLGKINFDDLKSMEKQIDLVLEIDNRTYRKVRKITYNYLTQLKISRAAEYRILQTVYDYQRQLYAAYMQFFTLTYDSGVALGNAEKMHLVVCRLLNAAFGMNKWRYFDDQPAPIGTWDNVYKIIRYGENLSLINTNLFLYDFQRKETSMATLLKRGFMMDTLLKGNYTRLQIELTEQILKAWSTNPLIVNKYRPNKYHFAICLTEDKGPERIRAVEKFSEYRFWKTTRLVELIESYILAANTHKPLDKFGLEKIAPPSVILKLFKKLRAEWCAEGYARQRRKENRNKKNKLISVSYGLEDICRRLSAVEKMRQLNAPGEGSAYDLKLANHRKSFVENRNLSAASLGSENWWMVDESPNGFGVDLGKEYSDWIEAGKLVGYVSPDDKQIFVIAEIKSVRKQSNGNYRAGLEILGSHTQAIRVTHVGQGTKFEGLQGYYVDDKAANIQQLNTFPGLLIDHSNVEKSSRPSLIMPRSEYQRGDQYIVEIEGDEKMVMAGSTLMRQREWVHMALPV